MSLKIKLVFVILAILITSFIGFTVWRNTIPLISPIALISVITGNSQASRSPKIVYGFFPYWNIKFANNLDISSLTHFAYFAIDLNPDGSINKVNKKREQEPGWNKLNSPEIEKLLYQSKLLGQRTALTVTAMDQDLINSLLQDDSLIATTTASIISVYRQFNFDDLNIDFEYLGIPTPQAQQNFTKLIRNIKAGCQSINARCQLSIDIFADSGSKTRIWNLSSLNPFVDHFIVMAYDYYRKTSTQAGPVAPLVGKCDSETQNNCVEDDIMSNLSQITKVINSEKIILGVPFYGYQWQTADRNFLSNTYPGTGSMASYSRILSIFSDATVSSLSAEWSSSTLSPYLVFEQNDQINQIHYENAQSLIQKIKLIKSANLGGLAIWALGYETPSNDLWDPIKNMSNL